MGLVLVRGQLVQDGLYGDRRNLDAVTSSRVDLGDLQMKILLEGSFHLWLSAVLRGFILPLTPWACGVKTSGLGMKKRPCGQGRFLQLRG